MSSSEKKFSELTPEQIAEAINASLPQQESPLQGLMDVNNTMRYMHQIAFARPWHTEHQQEKQALYDETKAIISALEENMKLNEAMDCTIFWAIAWNDFFFKLA